MKKFLRIKLPGSAKEVPAELDAVILSAAAMRAKANRRKRMFFRVAFPGAAVGSAAAAAVVMAMLPSTAPVVNTAVKPSMIQTIGHNKSVNNAVPAIVPPAHQTVLHPAPDMLSLADTSSLEQECYNLSIMSDFTLENDVFTI